MRETNYDLAREMEAWGRANPDTSNSDHTSGTDETIPSDFNQEAFISSLHTITTHVLPLRNELKIKLGIPDADITTVFTYNDEPWTTEPHIIAPTTFLAYKNDLEYPWILNVGFDTSETWVDRLNANKKDHIQDGKFYDQLLQGIQKTIQYRYPELFDPQYNEMTGYYEIIHTSHESHFYIYRKPLNLESFYSYGDRLLGPVIRFLSEHLNTGRYRVSQGITDSDNINVIHATARKLIEIE